MHSFLTDKTWLTSNKQCHDWLYLLTTAQILKWGDILILFYNILICYIKYFNIHFDGIGLWLIMHHYPNYGPSQFLKQPVMYFRNEIKVISLLRKYKKTKQGSYFGILYNVILSCHIQVQYKYIGKNWFLNVSVLTDLT